jgi:hypothetical protein
MRTLALAADVLNSPSVQMEQWQKRRSDWNHDWMKNQFMPALAKGLNVLDGRVADPEFLGPFFGGTLRQWEAQRTEVLALLTSFEVEMSPARLFDRAPLSQCSVETKQWLPPLAHALWLNRGMVHDLVADSADLLKRVDSAYTQIVENVTAGSSSGTLAAMQSCRPLLAAFRECCQRLAHAISDFPREIGCV